MIERVRIFGSHMTIGRLLGSLTSEPARMISEGRSLGACL